MSNTNIKVEEIDIRSGSVIKTLCAMFDFRESCIYARAKSLRSENHIAVDIQTDTERSEITFYHGEVIKVFCKS